MVSRCLSVCFVAVLRFWIQGLGFGWETTLTTCSTCEYSGVWGGWFALDKSYKKFIDF